MKKFRSYSPLRYPGGKGQIYPYVLSLLEQSNLIGCTYIEPYAGGAAIAIRLLVEKKVSKIIINDYDRSIFAVWYAILNNTDEFISLINESQINVDNWRLQKEIQKNKQDVSLLELALSTLFLNRTNRSGIIKAGVIGGIKQEGNYKMDCRFKKDRIIELIKLIASLKNQIELYNMDALVFLSFVKRKHNQFYFIDPPYYNKGKELYTNFYKHDDHKKLSSFINQKMRNKHILISYDNCVEINEMYKNNYRIIKELNYYVETKRKGEEVFVLKNISNSIG